MTDLRRVANPPDKPVMLYDADCRFCTLWIRRWQQSTGDQVEYRPLQDERVAIDFPDLERKRLEEAVHLVETDGTVRAGAEAVFRSLATHPRKRWLSNLYRRSPLFAGVTEGFYRLVADHRGFFSGATRALWGNQVCRPQHSLVRWTFLRALALIYFIAFVSLWVQVTGLVGEHGILPAANLMSNARVAFDDMGIGLDRYRVLPTLCWFGATDGFLQVQCGVGAMLSLLVLAGIAPRFCLAIQWLCYLSLATVGQVFLNFQWDALLLETGLLAVFFAPARLLPSPSRERPPPIPVLWLLRLLMFKLMFLSGVVKLASGDAAWRTLEALPVHYETQPLPNAIAWYLHQWPAWFHHVCCAVMFFIELAVPFLIFAPRRPRMIGAAALAFLQIVIIATGNYAFFNLLTLALCVPLLDDVALARILPRRLMDRLQQGSPQTRPAHSARPRWLGWATVFPVALVVGITTLQLVSPFRSPPGWMSPVAEVHRWLAPFRSINSYGLFAVMTTQRPEIIVEGSDDGVTWKPYPFRFKPGDPMRRPPFVAPHQPRLDWQMWFAALGTAGQNPWFIHFCGRLLQGEPEVLGLLEANPFPDKPPRYIRAQLYDYSFTTRDERRRTGAWWKREYVGDYLPAISLQSTQAEPSD